MVVGKKQEQPQSCSVCLTMKPHQALDPRHTSPKYGTPTARVQLGIGHRQHPLHQSLRCGSHGSMNPNISPSGHVQGRSTFRRSMARLGCKRISVETQRTICFQPSSSPIGKCSSSLLPTRVPNPDLPFGQDITWIQAKPASSLTSAN